MPDSDQGEVCLEAYCRAWDEYCHSSRALDRLFEYLNKQAQKKNDSLPTVQQIAIGTWCMQLFTNLNQKLSEVALRMLEQSRQGHEMNSRAIQSLVQTYMALGILKKTDRYDFDSHLEVIFRLLFLKWNFFSTIIM